MSAKDMATANKIDFLAGEKPFQSRIKIVRKKKGKKKQPKPINAVEAIHQKWFFNMEPKYFAQMCEEWNEHNLKLEIPQKNDYDEWLNYFKTLSPTAIRMLATTGLDILNTEAYAALSRWHDIISNPHRIEKIHQSGLHRSKGDGKTDSITKYARDNNRLGVLEATRDQIAEKLEKGAGARDTAALAREMTEIMTQIADYKKRMGPKKTGYLGSLLNDAEKLRKRPSENGHGARKNSFKSRVTVEDTEAKS